MALHLEEISLAVAPGAHALVLLDQQWRVSKKLPVPGNITLIPLPPNHLIVPGRTYLAIHARQLARRTGPTTASSITLLRLKQVPRYALEDLSIGTREWAYPS